MSSPWVAAQNLPRSSRPDGFRHPKAVGARNRRRASWRIVPYKLYLPVAPIPILSIFGPVMSAVLSQMLSEQPPTYDEQALEPFGIAKTYDWILRMVAGAGDERAVWHDRIWWAGAWRTLQGGVNTPTMVQHAASPSTYTAGGPGVGGIDQPLPNACLANNCIISTTFWGVTAGVTLSTPTDDGPGGSNTYAAGKTLAGSAGFIASASYVALNVKAGTRIVSTRFSGGTPINVACMVSEWYNIATSSAIDGAGNATENTSNTTTWAAGSFTPGTAGDLIYQAACDNSGGAHASFTAMASPAFTLLTADLNGQVMAEQFYVQPSAIAVNPTITSGTSSGYISVAFALKSAAAGTAPGTTVVRVVGLHAITATQAAGTNPTKFQFPTFGNLVAIGTSKQSGETQSITSITTTPSNTFVQTTHSPAANGTDVVITMWYAANATPSAALALSMNWSGTPSQNNLYVIWDIANASTTPYDTDAAGTGEQLEYGNLSTVTITPSQKNAITVYCSDQGNATIYNFTTDGNGHLPLFCLPIWQNPEQDENGTDGGAGSYFTIDSASGYFVNTSDITAITFIEVPSPAAGTPLGLWAAMAATFVSPPIPSAPMFRGS